MQHPEIEEDDYYLKEDGLMVFTEKYHLKRGYCCGNKCRHCPYQHINVPKKNAHDSKEKTSESR